MRKGPVGLDFDEWYRAEWPRLVASLAMMCSEREQARELAAEAFARALARWPRVGAMESPGGRERDRQISSRRGLATGEPRSSLFRGGRSGGSRGYEGRRGRG